MKSMNELFGALGGDKSNEDDEHVPVLCHKSGHEILSYFPCQVESCYGDISALGMAKS